MFSKLSLLTMIFLGVLFASQHLLAIEIRLATQPAGSALTLKGEPYINCAMASLNQAFKIKYMPWKRAQIETKKGVSDGFFMASQNEERDVYATLSEPIFVIKWLYVTRKGSNISPRNADFYTKIFSANLGSARHSWLMEQRNQGIIDKEITAPPAPASLLKMLLAGRVDVALMSSTDFNEKVEALAIDINQINTYVEREKPVGLYFSKTFIRDNPKFLNSFNDAMKECKKQIN